MRLLGYGASAMEQRLWIHARLGENVGRALRSLNAATIFATASPPACPMPSAATPACCAMADAPDVLWLWMAAAPLA